MLQFGNCKLGTYRSVFCVNIIDLGNLQVIQKRTIMEAGRKKLYVIIQLIQKCKAVLALREEKKNISCVILM
jgi:hypothetical protein